MNKFFNFYQKGKFKLKQKISKILVKLDFLPESLLVMNSHKKEISFSSLFINHNGNHADKWRGYLDIYDEILLNFKNHKINFLELGVNNGGSLEIFSAYFDKAEVIVGVDINENCSFINFNDERIKVIIGDSSEESIKERIKLFANKYNVIIDDASHMSDHIIKNFFNLVELVENGGIYIIEDLCCSYWNDYGGGLSKENSAITFFSDLINIVNYQHWEVDLKIKDFLKKYGVENISDSLINKLKSIVKISFYNSICVLNFADSNISSNIGKRICRGLPKINKNVGSDGDDIKSLINFQKE